MRRRRTARVPADVLLVLPLELVEVRHHPVVKVLTANVRVVGNRIDLKNAVVNRQQRDIKRPIPTVEDQDVLLARRALVKPARNRRRRRLADDPRDVQARNQPASFVARRCKSLKCPGT